MKVIEEKEYELVKVGNHYNLMEIGTTELVDDNVKDTSKVIASTLKSRDGEYHKLHMDSCRELFGEKELREPKISKKYKDAKYGSSQDLSGVLEIVRLQIYNYLSGRTNLTSLREQYSQLENTLWERRIIELNSASLDEDNDDEYFNDFLEADELKREFTREDLDKVYDWMKGTYGKEYKTYNELIKSLEEPMKVRVTLPSPKPDGSGYIEMFKYIW